MTQVVERMFRQLVDFLVRNDQGQDLAEYCLITAILALIGFGMFYNVSGGMQDLWGMANSAAVAANTSAHAGGGAAGAGPVNH
jgi:Flp pilus assembly pilin Flp